MVLSNIETRRYEEVRVFDNSERESELLRQIEGGIEGIQVGEEGVLEDNYALGMLNLPNISGVLTL